MRLNISGGPLLPSFSFEQGIDAKGGGGENMTKVAEKALGPSCFLSITCCTFVRAVVYTRMRKECLERDLKGDPWATTTAAAHRVLYAHLLE